MNKRQRQKFFRYVAALRREAPPDFPVKVRLVDYKKFCGKCWLDLKRKEFRIYVDRSCYQCAVDTLTHEWAHALAWAQDDEGLGEHHGWWGIEFARCYRIVDAEGDKLSQESTMEKCDT